MALTPRQKKWIQFAVKVSLTGLALFFVFKKIDPADFWENLKKTKPLWVVLAWLAFNVSKSIASLRLNAFYRACGARLSNWVNWRLYYLGMFYNMFLPGSISGDGYKVWLLRQHQKEVKWQQLAYATLLDRLSGLALLLLLACLMVYRSSALIPEDYEWAWYLPGLVFVLVLPVFYLGISLFFRLFTKVFWETTGWSLVVQLGQVLCAYCLLLSLGIEAYHWDYLTLFMASSVAAVIPITFSGVGLREVVFLWGYSFLSIDKDKAVTFTLLFFMVTALSSLFGLLVSSGLNLEKASNGKDLLEGSQPQQ